jgi:nucleotide-binding universal stress UspA family protein
MYRDIVTHAEPGPEAEFSAQFEAGFDLAGSGGNVSALIFRAETNETGKTEAEFAARDAACLELASGLARRRGIDCDPLPRSSHAYGIGDVVADRLRVGDLGVFVRRANEGPGRRMIFRAAIFDSGRPVILVPASTSFTVPQTIAIAWDASPAAVRAVHGALPLIAKAAHTLILTVSGDKEIREGSSAVALAHLLARHGAKAEARAVARGAGSVAEALCGAAQEAGAGLLVMGAVRHSPLHDAIFGSATRLILDEPPAIPVLLAA